MGLYEIFCNCGIDVWTSIVGFKDYTGSFLNCRIDLLTSIMGSKDYTRSFALAE